MKKFFFILLLSILSVTAVFGQPQMQVSEIEDQVANPDYNLLIVTENSEFKNQITNKLQTFLKENKIAVTMFVSPDFSTIETERYDAVLFMWHVESSKLQPSAAGYLNSVENKAKFILVASHGNGNLDADYKVDTVTDASAYADPGKKAEEIIIILKNKPGIN